MSDATRRRRPALPYRAYPIRRVLFECNRRLAAVRGPRAFELMAALIYRSPSVASGVVFLGDSCIDAGRDHCCGRCRKEGRRACEHPYCCMARLMGRCGKTAHRAKYDVADAGLVKLHHAGRGLKAGGSILDGDSRPVGAATGYQLDPSLFTAPKAPRPAPAKPARSGYQSPSTRATLEAGRRKLADALERMRGAGGKTAPP